MSGPDEKRGKENTRRKTPKNRKNLHPLDFDAIGSFPRAPFGWWNCFDADRSTPEAF